MDNESVLGLPCCNNYGMNEREGKDEREGREGLSHQFDLFDSAKLLIYFYVFAFSSFAHTIISASNLWIVNAAFPAVVSDNENS